MKAILIISLVLLFYMPTSAQKLPNVQKESVLAPANVKVDGKANEWSDQFKAYNNSTQIFYTIANDANNLYLVIQVVKPNIISKIVEGGITITIKNSASGKVTPLSVTYPLIPKPKWQEFEKAPNDTLLKINAVLVKVNNDLDAASKEIKLSGYKDIADSSISVYNDYGIKAAQLFNASRAWTYELAIPLKYMNQLINTDGELKYDIILNGVSASNTGAMIDGKQVSVNDPRIVEFVQQAIASGHGGLYLEMSSPTDVSGTYKLAK